MKKGGLLIVTNEFELGFEPMAKHFNLHKKVFGNGTCFELTPEIGTGWITQFQGAEGLFASSIWITPKSTLTYTITTEKPYLWIFGIDCGDIIVGQRGKPIKHLTTKNHVVVNAKNPLNITFPANVHVCCTCILVFDDFIQFFMQGRLNDETITMKDMQEWTDAQYNTPDITLVLEQIKWSARNGVVPLFHYECKMGELLSLILRNSHIRRGYVSNRRYHVTWENEQKLGRIKDLIDLDVLNAPTIEQLAMSEAMSTSKLHRCFKQFYQMTIFDYVRTEKLKKAMLMLACDELSIKNIGEKCGYESPSKFTIAFKEIHSITPSQYRKSFNL